MTISTLATKTTYGGDGVSTSFAIPFQFFAATEVGATTVTVNTATALALNIGYTVAGGNDATGTLTLPAPLAVGTELVIYRATARTQTASFVANDNFAAATLDTTLDRMVALEQEDAEAISRCLSAPIQDAAVAPLPPAALRAGGLLAFDGGGNPYTVPVATFQAVTPPAVPVSTYFVRNFGAVGDGITDDTAAIQVALSYVGANGGGTLVFDAKNYKITTGLTIGSGSATLNSSWAPVFLQGVKSGWLPNQFYGPNTNPSGTRIIWDGAVGGIMITILGPLQAWGISGIILDADQSATFLAGANTGCLVIAAGLASNTDLVIRGCKYGVYIQGASPPINTSAQHNRFVGLRVAVPNVTGACGVVLTGTSQATAGYNVFIDTMIALPASLSTGALAYGIYFAAAKNNLFYSVHFLNGGAGASAVAYDYTINSSWPSGNQIIAPDWGGIAVPVAMAGAAGAGAAANYVSGMIESNLGQTPIAIPNLTMQWGVSANYAATALAIAYTQQVLCIAQAAGLYRVNYHLLVTAGPNNGGTVSLSIAWTGATGDAGGATSAPAADAAGTFVQGAVVIHALADTAIIWSTTLSTTEAGLQYSLFIAVERLL